MYLIHDHPGLRALEIDCVQRNTGKATEEEEEDENRDRGFHGNLQVEDSKRDMGTIQRMLILLASGLPSSNPSPSRQIRYGSILRPSETRVRITRTA